MKRTMDEVLMELRKETLAEDQADVKSLSMATSTKKGPATARQDAARRQRLREIERKLTEVSVAFRS